MTQNHLNEKRKKKKLYKTGGAGGLEKSRFQMAVARGWERFLPSIYFVQTVVTFLQC
jgi:hypothetical protein